MEPQQRNTDGTHKLEYNERGHCSFFTGMFVRRGTVMPFVIPQVVLCVLWSVAVVACYKYGWHAISVAPEVHIMTGSLVALLCVFRNNVSHTRFTEARTLLGRIKAGMRTVCTVAHAVPPTGFNTTSASGLDDVKLQLKNLCKELQVLFAAMVVDVRDSREEESSAEGPAAMPNAAPVRGTLRKAVNRIVDSRTKDNAWMYRRYSAAVRPAIVAQCIVRMVMKLAEDGVLATPAAMTAVGVINDQILMSWDGLVRIVTTPAPFPYRHLMSTLAFMFTFTLPFGLVAVFGWATVPAVGMVTAAYYGVLRLAMELENPLGFDLNDINLTAIAATVAEECFAIHASTFGVPEDCPSALGRNERLALTFVSNVQNAMNKDATYASTASRLRRSFLARAHGVASPATTAARSKRVSAMSIRSASSRVTFSDLGRHSVAAAPPPGVVFGGQAKSFVPLCKTPEALPGDTAVAAAARAYVPTPGTVMEAHEEEEGLDDTLEDLPSDEYV